jgi:transposase-like protein
MGSNARPIGPVIGPEGDVLTAANLPPKDTKRWVPRRKAEIIAAVGGGLITLTDACSRYAISHEEFRAWVSAYERHGLPGLRAGLRERAPSVQAEPPV